MKKIAFIGVGIMGKAMVRNLMKNGYEVSIFTRTKAKVLNVIEEGAIWCEDIKTCVANKDMVITIVGSPKDVADVYFGENGIIENSQAGTYLIDMTTTSPELSKKIYTEASKKQMFALDAPVSGGDIGAQNGTLSIMVGGDLEVFQTCEPIFRCLGTNVIYEGQVGNGQHTKMANQIALAGAIAGVCEAMTYAKEVGLDIQAMLDSISQGAAGSWQMTNMAPRILNNDLNSGFFIKHYIKDMNIAREEAGKVSLDLGVLNQVLSMYQALNEKGLENAGTQALIKYYDK